MIDRRRVGVFAAGFVTFVDLYPVQALLPTFAERFGVSLARTGLTVTATLIAVAVVAPFVGGISDALGRRRLIVGSAALLTLPTLAAAFAPDFGILLACRFAQGLLLPFIFAITVAYIAEECPGPDAVRVTGAYMLGTILGGFSGRFIAGWTAQYLDWHGAFVVLAAITAGLAATVALCLPPEQRFRPISGWRGSIGGFRDQFANPQVMATCAVGFAVLFSMVGTFTFANFLLAAPPFGLGPAELGSVFVTYLVGAASTPLASRLTLRIGRLATVRLATATVCVGLGLTLLPGLPAVVAGLGLVAMGVFTQQTLSIGYVALAARQARSTAVGLYVTCYYVGGSLGGIAPAGVWARFGWPGTVALIFGVQLLLLTVTWLAWPRRTGLPSPHMPQVPIDPARNPPT